MEVKQTKFDNFKWFIKKINSVNKIKRKSSVQSFHGNGLTYELSEYYLAQDFLAKYIYPYGYDFITKKLIESNVIKAIPNIIELCHFVEDDLEDTFNDFMSTIGLESYVNKCLQIKCLVSYDALKDFFMKFRNSENFEICFSALIAWFILDDVDDENVNDEYLKIVNRFGYDFFNINVIKVTQNVSMYLKKYWGISTSISLDKNEAKANGEFFLSWKYVEFRNGFVFLTHPRSKKITRHVFPQSKMAFDSVPTYIKKKLQFFYVYSKDNKIVSVKNLAALTECLIILDKYTSRPKITLEPKKLLPLKSATSEEIRERIRQLRSKYLDLLCSIHLDSFKLVYCIERSNHAYSPEILEDAFIFTIKARNYCVVVYENINVDRSTIVFYINSFKYNKAISTIHELFASDMENKRQTIARNNLKFKDSGILRVERVIHTNFNSWKSTIMKHKY